MFSIKYILLIFTVVALVILAVYGRKEESAVVKSPQNTPEVSPSIPEPDFRNFKIKDNLIYELPEKWKLMKEYPSTAYKTDEKGVSTPYAHFIVYSHEGDSTKTVTDDIRLAIEVSDTKKSTEKYMDPNQYKKGEIIQIDNAPVVKSRFDDSNQGFFQEYRFIHKNLQWKIWIQTKNLEYEKAHHEEINSFINSIKFL